VRGRWPVRFELERDGLATALSRLRAGDADGLIVSKLDRLTRSVKDLGELLDGVFSKVELVAVDDSVDSSSATGRLVLNILVSVSQWEREVISERTSEALLHKLGNGEYTGGRVPFGYELDGQSLIPIPEEQKVITAIHSMRKQGSSYRDIAGRVGLHHQTVARILKREWD